LFSVNARAPFFLSEALGLKMKQRGRGKIVNIADWAALRPYTQYVPYCASKAALVAVSQGLAKSLAPRVQVNTILPGPVMWPDDLGPEVLRSVLSQTPLQRIGKPEDIAHAVKFLIEGDYMTGSLIHVDGGRSIK
ncbi:MAG TPA: SDR family oxidoreductase, partial [bacterium]|nr:SDR family oxidoreductase [bacterium]